MKYSPEDIKVVLCAGTDHEIVIEGFATTDLIHISREQDWHKLLRIDKNGVHVVQCRDNSFNSYLVSFTEAGYNKHIKDLKPSVKSPFYFKEIDL